MAPDRVSVPIDIGRILGFDRDDSMRHQTDGFLATRGGSNYDNRIKTVRFGITRAVWAGLLAILVLGHPVSEAADEVDSGLLAMLPPYCEYSQIWWQKLGRKNPEQQQLWHQKMGPGFAHIHHYCNGLYQTHTALLRTRSKKERDSLLTTSLGEFDYVLRNAPDGFVLLPEILVRKGQNLIRLGRGPEAIEVMVRAMSAKPDYWPAYGYLSDYYKDIGEREKARQVLEKGLANSPDAKALRSRLTALGRPAETDKN